MSQSVREFMGIGAQGIGASQTAQKPGLRETFKEFFKKDNLKKAMKDAVTAATPFNLAPLAEVINPKPNVQEALQLFDRPNPGGLMMADNPLIQQGIENLKDIGPAAQLYAAVGPGFQNAAAFADEKFGSGNIPKAYGGAMPNELFGVPLGPLGGGIYMPNPESVTAGVDNEFLAKQKLQDDYVTPLFHEIAHLAIEGQAIDPSYKTGTGGIGAGSEELPVMLSDAIYGQGGVKSELVQSGFATPEGEITQEGVAALQGQNLPRPVMEALGMAPENPNLMSGPFQIPEIQEGLLSQYQLDRRKQFEQDLAGFQSDFASNMNLLTGGQAITDAELDQAFRFFSPTQYYAGPEGQSLQVSGTGTNPYLSKLSPFIDNFNALLPSLGSLSRTREGVVTDFDFGLGSGRFLTPGGSAATAMAPSTTFDPSGIGLSSYGLDYFGPNYSIGGGNVATPLSYTGPQVANLTGR